jgi:hypothetical protein
VIGYGRAGRLAWWLCRPSLGRALLCGAVAIYLGTFIGADAVTMFCAAQVARLALRALARRSVRVEPVLPTQPWQDRSTAAIEPDADPGFAIAERYEETNHAAVSVSDPEPELTLDELIAGDPGPEPGDPGPELDEPVTWRSSTEAGANGDDAVRIASWVDRQALAVSAKGGLPVAGSEAAEALRIAVAERAEVQCAWVNTRI